MSSIHHVHTPKHSRGIFTTCTQWQICGAQNLFATNACPMVTHSTFLTHPPHFRNIIRRACLEESVVVTNHIQRMTLKIYIAIVAKHYLQCTYCAACITSYRSTIVASSICGMRLYHRFAPRRGDLGAREVRERLSPSTLRLVKARAISGRCKKALCRKMTRNDLVASVDGSDFLF